jgi:hypothetical protein
MRSKETLRSYARQIDRWLDDSIDDDSETIQIFKFFVVVLFIYLPALALMMITAITTYYGAFVVLRALWRFTFGGL